MSRITTQNQSKNEAKKLSELRCSKSGKLIITGYGDKLCAFLTCENRLVCVTVLDDISNDKDPICEGDVVIAYVRDVKEDIGACFIEYAKDKDGYLPFNKLPKEVNVRQGDLIPVRLSSKAQKGKRASFTAKIDYSKYENGTELQIKSSHLTKYSYLYKNTDSITVRINKVFRDDEYDEIITDKKEVYDIISASFPKVRLYTDESFDLSKLYSLRSGLDDALNKNVWLKCGGYLTIDHTEAMTVIDVNSGKFKPSKGTDKEEAYLNVNREAAVEICRQLRLRNISGIVIIDFINLKSDEASKELLELLRTESESDTVTVRVLDITQLGLAELTRKKELPPLYEQLKK